MVSRCVLFTGPSGLNVRDALDKLADYCARQRVSRPAVVILDDKMITQFLEKYPDEPMRDRMLQPGGFQRLLLEPKEYLLKLWCDTVENSVSEISQSAESAFLFLHSVYYHTSSRDFFSCVDLDHLERCLLNKELEISLVLTLVDDIYDMWRRLKGPGQLFFSSNNVVEGIADLLLLLYWRSMEILTSARIAADLDVPHFLVALKHPLSVVYDLIFSDKVPVYVAHPITEVRKLESGDVSDRTKADDLKEEIRQLTNTLANSDIVLPIYPTGIDELVFKEDSSRRILPELLSRWPYDDPVNLLFVPPDASIPEPFNLEGPDEPEAMSLLLRHFADGIEAQINSRDRTLVEQTEAVVAWRPYYNGHPSSGVDNEIRHRNKMVERELCQKESKQCFILSRWEDVGWFRLEKIYELLVNERAALPPEMTAIVLRNRSKLLLDKVACDKGQITGEELSETVDPDNTISFPLPRADTGALRRRRSLAEEEAHIKGWATIADKVNASFPEFEFLDTDIIRVDDAFTIGEFVRTVEKFVQPKRQRRTK